jgi:hypothetical protein
MNGERWKIVGIVAEVLAVVFAALAGVVAWYSYQTSIEANKLATKAYDRAAGNISANLEVLSKSRTLELTNMEEFRANAIEVEVINRGPEPIDMVRIGAATQAVWFFGTPKGRHLPQLNQYESFEIKFDRILNSGEWARLDVRKEVLSRLMKIETKEPGQHFVILDLNFAGRLLNQPLPSGKGGGVNFSFDWQPNLFDKKEAEQFLKEFQPIPQVFGTR